MSNLIDQISHRSGTWEALGGLTWIDLGGYTWEDIFKSIDGEASPAFRWFRAGCEFYHLVMAVPVDAVTPADYPFSLDTPKIANLAFSCELFMKALLTEGGIEFGHKHKLDYLYHLLPANDREVILEHLSMADPEFNDEIEKAGDAFTNWRYECEDIDHNPRINARFVVGLATTMRDICSSRFKPSAHYIPEQASSMS